jgi:hypothetical protein
MTTAIAAIVGKSTTSGQLRIAFAGAIYLKSLVACHDMDLPQRS